MTVIIKFFLVKLRKTFILLAFLSVSTFMNSQTGHVVSPKYKTGTGEGADFQPNPSSNSLKWIQRTIPTEKINALKKEEAFWYADKEFAEKEKAREKEKLAKRYIPLGQRTWFQTVLWLVIIGGFAALLSWFLAGSQIGIFRKSRKKQAVPQTDDINTTDIFAINYHIEIEKAFRMGNYRFAIRLMYLRLLKEMDELTIIHYRQDKTNADYLIQLKSTSYYTDFFRVTRHYEYTWYGLFNVDQEAYQSIKSDFEQIGKKILYR